MDNNVKSFRNIAETLFDRKFRERLRKNPNKHAKDFGYQSPHSNINFVVKTNTKNVVYLAMFDASSLKVEDIRKLQAGMYHNASMASIMSVSQVVNRPVEPYCFATSRT